MNTQVDSGAFTGFDDFVFYLFTHFGNHFFDTCRMNTSVCHQLMKCQAGYFAANRVECRKHDSFRGVIHYDFNTCCCFQSTDVTSFTTDDATFDFIGFDMEYGDRVFDSCFCSNSLNGLDNDSFGFLVGCQLGIVHDIIDVRSSLCFGFLLQRVHQTFFGFFGRQTG